jgi:hypothetical protein
MRLINSDGQICDAKVVAKPGGNANRNSITLVDGRLSIIAICTAICGVSLAFAIWAGYQADLMTTEYRVVLNHTMEMEAKQEVLIKEVEELKHGNR